MTTNQQQIDQFFDFEKEKHSSFFLPYYEENNWKVLEDNIDGNVPISWDVNLQYENNTTDLVDEKARTTDYGDCVIEFIQDVKSQSWGWYYGKKDVVLYANWKDPHSDNPSSFHSIRMSKLHEYIDNLDRQTFKAYIICEDKKMRTDIYHYYKEFIGAPGIKLQDSRLIFSIELGTNEINH